MNKRRYGCLEISLYYYSDPKYLPQLAVIFADFVPFKTRQTDKSVMIYGFHQEFAELEEGSSAPHYTVSVSVTNADTQNPIFKRDAFTRIEA